MRNTLGIVLPMGQNRRRLEESGQWSLWYQELEFYRKKFEGVELFEYRHSDWWRYIEALLMPVIQSGRFRRCRILKAVHLTGAISCLISRLLYRTNYVLSYGYRYDEFAAVEKKWGIWLLTKILTPIAIKFAETVMVPTKELKRYVLKFGAKEVEVIPNGVNTQLFKGPTLSTQGRTLRILFVGRLEKQKNLETLIRALSSFDLFRKKTRDSMSRNGISGKLVIIGDGSLKQELRDLAIKLKVNVDSQGVVANDELPVVYKNADIFVLPSLVEGHPKALIEAMSCGLACIASDIAGVREIIENEVNGLLVQPTEVGLAEGLKQLINDISLRRRFGIAARKTVVNRFDKSRLMRREISILRKVAFAKDDP